MAEAWSNNFDLGRITLRMREGAAAGLHDAVEHALGESNRIVPIEEGTLERSGRTSVDPDNLQAAVSYDTPYAVRQHEDLTYHHDQGREAKYLEKTMAAEADQMREIIAARIRASLGT